MQVKSSYQRGTQMTLISDTDGKRAKLMLSVHLKDSDAKGSTEQQCTQNTFSSTQERGEPYVYDGIAVFSGGSSQLHGGYCYSCIYIKVMT